jgi:hypothetical protein
MKNRGDRLMKCGVVALAAIAVTCWIRELEKDPSSHGSADAGSIQARAVFPPTPDTPGVQGFSMPLGDPVAVRDEAEFTRAVKERRVNRPIEPDVVKTRDVRADSGMHEDPQPSADQPKQERSLEPEVKDGAVRNPSRSQDNGAVNTGGQNQPVVNKKALLGF